MTRFRASKKALLRWGYDRLWHRWPLMIVPLVRIFRRGHGYWPNLLRPRSFNEKILFRILFDRRPHLPLLAGKLEVREHVRRRLGGDQHLVPLLGVIRRAEDLRALTLPPDFILKANHGSGMLHVQRASHPPNLDALERQCAHWIAGQYGKYQREWVYRDVESLILAEHLLLDDEGHIPHDCRIYCFDGEPRFIATCEGRFAGNQTQCFFWPDWTPIALRLRKDRGTRTPPPRPEHLGEMLDIARRLSRGIDFVRVDLYDVQGRVWFGELTCTPGAARSPIDPRSADFLLGSFWKLDTRTRLRD